MRSLIAVAAVVLASPVVAFADTAKDYNLFVAENMSVQGSDVEGRVAVGGDAKLEGHSVGDKASASGVNLVVGGDLTTKGGSTKGKFIVGGDSSFTWYDASGLQPAGTPSLIDFDAEVVRLKDLSAYLASKPVTGSTNYVTYGGPHGYQTTFTGTETGLNIFNLDGALGTDTNTFTINIKPGSTALINVSGTSGKLWGAGIFINGGDASSILWNFADATSLSFYNIGISGSVLAPNADYKPGGYGVINGQVVVKSFFGDYSGGATQVNNVKFSGDLLGLTPPGKTPTIPLSAVPEPATWAMMITGFGLVGATVRRRRATASFA